MPSSHFDERHLREVVLAQSGQIRATKRNSGLEIFTRPLVALTAIVAIVAIALGIRDYIQPQKANALTNPDAPTVAHPKAITRPKKNTSTKSERSRMSAAEATAAEAAQAAADGIEKPLIIDESAEARTKRTIVMGYSPNTLSAPAARDEREVAIDRDNGTVKERDTSAKPATCLPLPNGTQPGDVDGPYYSGWATEYCGLDLNRASTPPKDPKSLPPRR